MLRGDDGRIHNIYLGYVHLEIILFCVIKIDRNDSFRPNSASEMLGSRVTLDHLGLLTQTVPRMLLMC